MKIAFIVLMTISAAFGAAACFPANSALKAETNTNERNQNAEAARSDSLFDEEKNVSLKDAETQTAPETKQKEDNFVCPEPDRPCQHKDREFAEWELPFRLPAKIRANTAYRSAPFYAVILKKYDEGCNPDEMDFDSKIENERLALQKKFPARKVFAEYSCPNLDAVGYEFDGKLDKTGERILYMDYIAVYAGADEAEGREIFELIRADYPQAELKKMTAVYEKLEM